MNKIRCSLAAIVLVATLSGLFLQGSVANAASSRYASAVNSALVVGQLARSGALRPYPICPVPGPHDC